MIWWKLKPYLLGAIYWRTNISRSAILGRLPRFRFRAGDIRRIRVSYVFRASCDAIAISDDALLFVGLDGHIALVLLDDLTEGQTGKDDGDDEDNAAGDGDTNDERNSEGVAGIRVCRRRLSYRGGQAWRKMAYIISHGVMILVPEDGYPFMDK